jgi:hypothetical protein
MVGFRPLQGLYAMLLGTKGFRSAAGAGSLL